MWNYSILMVNLDDEAINKIKKYAKISGVLFIIIGLAGIIFPQLLSITTELLISYLMLFAGVSSAWFTWVSNRKDWTAWLKSFILIGVSTWMILNPMHGIAVLGLVFSFYFFTDAFAGFGIALSLRPDKVWRIWLLNATTSLLMGVLFIWGWPFSSLYVIGLFVGISLLFDGIALLMGGILLDK